MRWDMRLCAVDYVILVHFVFSSSFCFAAAQIRHCSNILKVSFLRQYLGRNKHCVFGQVPTTKT